MPTQSEKRLNKLNISKAPGPDQIHTRVIRDLSDIVPIPLTILFNASIQRTAKRLEESTQFSYIQERCETTSEKLQPSKLNKYFSKPAGIPSARRNYTTCIKTSPLQ